MGDSSVVFVTCETKNKHNLWYFLNVRHPFLGSEYCLQDHMRTKRSSGYACRPLVLRMIGNWMCPTNMTRNWLNWRVAHLRSVFKPHHLLQPNVVQCFQPFGSGTSDSSCHGNYPFLRCWNYRSASRASKNVGNPRSGAGGGNPWVGYSTSIKTYQDWNGWLNMVKLQQSEDETP